MATFRRMLGYFGFEIRKGGQGLVIVSSPIALQRQEIWLAPGSWHVHSISRILQSLMLLDFQDVAALFYKALSELYSSKRAIIGDRDFRYWTQAVENKDYWNSST